MKKVNKEIKAGLLMAGSSSGKLKSSKLDSLWSPQTTEYFGRFPDSLPDRHFQTGHYFALCAIGKDVFWKVVRWPENWADCAMKAVLLEPFGWCAYGQRVSRGLFNFPKGFLLRFWPVKNEGLSGLSGRAFPAFRLAFCNYSRRLKLKKEWAEFTKRLVCNDLAVGHTL